MAITVLAMAGGGEVYITRDSDGTVRSHHRYLPGEPLEISAGKAEQVIEDQAYERLNVTLPNWVDVDNFTESRIPRLRFDASQISVRLARAMLPELREARLDPARSNLVAPAVARLLSHDDVRRNDAVSAALLALLSDPTDGRATMKPAVHERTEIARSYFSEAVAA